MPRSAALEAGTAALLSRTDSVCPTREEQLLEAVQAGRAERVRALVAGRPSLLRYVHPGPDRTALLVACAEPAAGADTVRVLLQLGADPLAADPEDEGGWAALHHAAACADAAKIRAVLDHLPPGHVDDTAAGSNALHVLLTYGEEACREREAEGDLLECVRLLVDAGIDLNAGDANNVSPVLWAAKKGRGDVVTALLDNGVRPVDIDTHTSRGKTARQLIEERQLYGRPLPPPVPPAAGPRDADRLELMFAYLRRGQETAFLNCGEEAVRACANTESVGRDATLLQLCCRGGMRRAAGLLLRCGADPNRTAQRNPRTPVELAAEGGRRLLLRLLLADGRVRVPSGVLCYLASKQRPGGEDVDVDVEEDVPFDYAGCYAELMEAVRRRGAGGAVVDVNGEDERSNTPLHYAARYAGPQATLQLLDAGASLAAHNRFGIMPIEDVDATVLERHLDDCIEFELDSKKFDKEDFTVTFNYETLLPPPKRVATSGGAPSDGPDAECVGAADRYDYVEEMEVIYYMSRAVEFKHLLKHPLIVSFLFMKWHRIRWLFYINLVFYMVFVLSTVTYIFTWYARLDDDAVGERSRPVVVAAYASYALLWLTYVLLVVRELFQLVASVSRYLINLENYMEIALVVITGCILTDNPPTDDARRQLSALAILLAAFELVLMLGQHPLLSTNVVMLRTVSYNFFKFLLWYSLLIVAFSMSFYLLFAEPPAPPPSDGPADDGVKGGEGEQEEDFFESPGKSVFKTIVMLTGEFDASGLNFRAHPVLSKLIFVLFVFMIAIILLNLLTGLAVSDTQMIRSDAELVGHQARAAHVRHVEALLVGEWAAGEWALLEALRRLCCCCPRPDINPSVWRSLRPLAGRACVFPDPLDRRLTVHPNRGGQVDVPPAPKGGGGGKRAACAAWGPVRLDRETVRRTVAIMHARRDQEHHVAPGLAEKVAALQRRQDDVATKLDEINRKLDRIIAGGGGTIE